MILYASSLVLLWAIGTALAQESQQSSILVCFSSEAGLNAVLEHITPPDDGTSAGVAADMAASPKQPYMLNIPLTFEAGASVSLELAEILNFVWSQSCV